MTSEAEELVPDEPLEPLLDALDEDVRPESRETSRANLGVYLKEIGHETIFYWYVTACIFVSLLVYALMRETRYSGTMDHAG